MVRPEKSPGPLDGKALQGIGVEAAGMEAMARIPFRRFGAEDRALSFKNGSGCMVFSGDEVQGILNSSLFKPDNFCNLGVVVG